MKIFCLPCVFVVLGYLIDSGDGQWEKLRINQLKQDVLLLENIADNLQHEIEELYAEDHHQHKRKHKPRRHKHATQTNATVKAHSAPDGPVKSKIHITQTADAMPSKTDVAKTADTMRLFAVQKQNISDVHWPKFEEILSMNRRKYDWKNDRWIKLNGDLSKKTRREKEFAKRRFSYRRVRLNDGSTKGNVIAVSAVR